LTLWAYRNFVKTATGFTPFQLVYGLEVVLPIECEIPSLKIAIELLRNTSIEEEWFMYLTKLDEICCDASLANETHQKCIKTLLSHVNFGGSTTLVPVGLGFMLFQNLQITCSACIFVLLQVEVLGFIL
jgi:hypothetical protein